MFNRKCNGREAEGKEKKLFSHKINKTNNKLILQHLSNA